MENSNIKWWKVIRYGIFFIPIYISTSGIYKSEVTETGLHLGETGLVFPGLFFVAIYFSIVFISKFTILSQGVNVRDVRNPVITLVSVLLLLGLVLSCIGVFYSSSLEPFIRLFQMVSGFFGVFIFWYLFILKKLDVVTIFGYISIFYIGVIILNYFSSFISIGMLSFSSNLLPSIFNFGIYQSHVYYPYIISMICFMGVPFILKQKSIYLFLYLSVFFVYILSWQVRGAILTFVIMFVLLFLTLLNNKQRIFAGVFTLILLQLIIALFGSELLLGRFVEIEKVSTFNGRSDIWLEQIKSMDISYLLFGNLFIEYDGTSLHNQYLQLVDYGGIILLLPIVIFFLYILSSWIKCISIKSFSRSSKVTFYLLSLILIQFLIDLNVNTPLNNTNPSLYYLFYWSSIIMLYNNEGEGATF